MWLVRSIVIFVAWVLAMGSLAACDRRATPTPELATPPLASAPMPGGLPPAASAATP